MISDLLEFACFQDDLSNITSKKVDLISTLCLSEEHNIKRYPNFINNLENEKIVLYEKPQY
jgi:predicted nucleotidyltransferase